MLIDGEAYFGAFAEAVERAAHSIIVLGWDFNSRVRLRSPHGDDGAADRIGALLDRALRERPGLNVYILEWDFSVLYAWQRELLSGWRFGQASRDRLHFRLDDRHPLGAARHQKIVVIDDALAFVGGIDFGPGRWDTPQHRADDPRRIDPSEHRYPPFHDVQMAVDGDAAAALGGLARARWLRVTGARIAPASAGLDPWPALVSDFTDVDVAIARTRPAYRSMPEVREVETLHLDAIAVARRWLYIETQYLTSDAIGDALAVRLRERDGPEVVIVQPRQCEGWLEQTTMGPLRGRLAQRLRAADRYDRLRLLYPHVRGLAAGQRLTVHAKVMVVDERLLRIGSANLNNRSMGLDSECDLAIEAGSDPTRGAEIAAIRDRLVGEHVGQSPALVARLLKQTGSLIQTIERLNGDARALRPLDIDDEPWLAQMVLDGSTVDPDCAPPELSQLVSSAFRLRRGRHRVWPLAAALLIAGALAYGAVRARR